jgi:hypothetical protein
MGSKSIVCIVLALMLAYFPCRALSSGNSQQSYLGAGIPYDVRNATLDDISDIADILVDAGAPSASYKYVHQFRDQYPGYYRRCMQKAMRKMMADSSDQMAWRILSVPDKTAPKGTRAVSVGIWDFRGKPTETFWSMAAAAAVEGGDLECSKRLDVNATRDEYHSAQFNAAMRKYIDEAYESQAYLAGLATHPDWDGNGFAAVNVRWGLDVAHERGLPATLLSTPAGYPLYRSLGYDNIINISIEFLDRLGSVWLEVMEFKSP